DFIKNFLDNKDKYGKNIFSNNQSGLLFKGLNVTELNLSYAREIFLPKLYVGGSIKYLIGTSIYYNFLVFNEQEKLDFDDVVNLQKKVTKNSNALTLDLGTIYQLPIPIQEKIVKPQVGLVLKNLIEPEFELAGTSEKLKLPRQAKVGSSVELLRMFTLAVDYDLLKTETFVPGYNNQNLALGVEFKLPILLSLRAGYLKNLAMTEEEMFTGGIGFRIFALNIDLSAAIGNQNIKIEETYMVPTGLALALGIRLDF
ncbi:MAG: conjugal transfer protein TraF, partial [Endomicrobiia bacterium]